jgi:hypothetical protein
MIPAPCMKGEVPIILVELWLRSENEEPTIINAVTESITNCGFKFKKYSS